MAYRRPSSEVQFKAEEEGSGRERNGRTTFLSAQGRALSRPKPLPRAVRGGDREELCHDPSPCPGPSEVETGKSFATTQALAQDRQRWRQGRALPRPKPLPRTVRGGDREELCHDPSPCPGPSEVETVGAGFNSATPPRPQELLQAS